MTKDNYGHGRCYPKPTVPQPISNSMTEAGSNPANNLLILLDASMKAWKQVDVVFIPKGGKIHHAKAKNYRPISLS